MKEYIERGKVQEMLENAHIISDEYDAYCGYCTEDVDISSIPAADVVERKRGEWVINERGFAECTECKFERIGIPLVHRLNFCPNCGADMRGENNG